MTPVLSLVTSLSVSLLDLVLPARCVGCSATGTAWCPRCVAGLQPLTRQIAGVGPVVAAGEYDGAGRAALLRYKERGRRELGPPLGRALGAVVHALAPPPGAVLVPVVSARAAARARGGDHVVRLARTAAAVAGLRVSPALRAVGPGHESVGLSAVERRRAVRGSLAARCPARPGRPAVLVDDVVTTGATLAEATRVLRAAGWNVVAAAVVLAVPDLACGARS